jgi:hypothetical protein
VTSLLFIAGLAAIVAGVAMLSLPAAFIVGGVELTAGAVAFHLGGDR